MEEERSSNRVIIKEEEGKAEGSGIKDNSIISHSDNREDVKGVTSMGQDGINAQ